mmetsp:Transcript_21038/g.49903  ORF Transcript_21038/g.49903 Transcript_21038/m.49903 type:complete len:163 (-) Transcript_21038:43-531(-)
MQCAVVDLLSCMCVDGMCCGMCCEMCCGMCYLGFTRCAQAIDIGQAEGAFVIALGHVLQEQVVIDDKTGEVTSASTWKYKPPLAVNLPTEFICEFNDTPHAKGILSSKASGEPPMCLAISGVGTAVRHAVAAARKDFGHDPWCELPIPLTPPVVAAACGAKL